MKSTTMVAAPPRRKRLIPDARIPLVRCDDVKRDERLGRVGQGGVRARRKRFLVRRSSSAEASSRYLLLLDGHVAADQGSLAVRLAERHPDQAHDGRSLGRMPTRSVRRRNLAVESLLRVVAPDLSQVHLGKTVNEN